MTIPIHYYARNGMRTMLCAYDAIDDNGDSRYDGRYDVGCNDG